MKMEYLNQFHKESSERMMKQVEEWRKNPIPASEASAKQFEMHKRIARLYPEKKLFILLQCVDTH